jgi:hypothetical protein
MKTKLNPRVGLFTLIVLLPGCATHFSPSRIREEIALQRGQEPLGVFELNLGTFTTLILKNALTPENGKVPFAGLEQFQLAVYELPVDAGPVIDVTRIQVQGWETVVNMLNQSRSAMVLVRGKNEAINDLVVVGSGRQKVVYARLRGVLSRDLPKLLEETLRDGGPDALQNMLNKLAHH